MDDVTNVTLMLQADAPLGIAFPYHDEYAGLVIRCRKGKTDLYVATRTPVKTDYDDDYESLGSKVRYRFDEGRPRTDYWSEATDHAGLFATDPIELARRLSKTRDWKFEFTPFDAASVTVDFTTAGLATVLPQVARACHWRV